MTKQKVSDEEIRAATWANVVRDDNGVITTVLGKPIEDLTVANLRLLCQTLKMQGYKSAGKPMLIKMMNDYATN